MRERLARPSTLLGGYVLLVCALATGYFLAPYSAATAVLYMLVALSSSIAVLVGVARNRPSRPLPWLLLSLGQFGFTIGEGITYWHAQALGIELPVPSIADAFYLSMYPFLAAGLTVLIRRRTPGGDRAALLDALIVTIALGLVSWVFLISPLLGISGTALGERMMTVAYPMGDMLLLAVILRLAADRGARGGAFWLLSLSLVPLLIADTAYAGQVLNGDFSTGSVLDVGWLSYFALLGTAALHPSMVDLDRVAEQRRTGISGARFAVLLAFASLLVPAVTAIRAVRGNVEDLPLLGAVAAVLFVLVVVRIADLVRELRDMQRQRSEGQFQRLTEHVTDLITICDHSGVIRYQTPSVSRVLGWSPDDLVGHSVMEFVHPDDAERVATLLGNAAREGRIGPVESRLRHSSGAWVTAETLGQAFDDEDLRGFLLTTRDITERKALEDQLTHKAFHDDLTGLANRALLADRVQHALERRDQPYGHLAVLVIDLDDFKTINDSLGRAIGDELICAVADRLRGSLRAADTAARIGGDEFAMLLDNLDDAAEAARIAQRVLDALRVPLELHGRQIPVRASIGIALADPDKAPDADEVLRNADVAMHMAKRQGRNRFAYFAPSMHAGLMRKLDLLDDLRQAIERRELRVHYQPLVELETGRMIGAEALVRWEHPRRGMVRPDEFIPLAEETGLVVPLGYAVLNMACRQAATWRQHAPISVSVNLSPRQVQDPMLVSKVRDALAKSGLPPGALTLEITESLLSEDAETAAQRLRALKALGVRLAVDDFGTGYSSLSRLREFPIDILKIPKPFVDNIATDPVGGSALARAIVDLSTALGLDTVGEGIEQPEQAEALKRLGCRVGQGYLFARPVPLDELEKLIVRGDLRPVATRTA